MHDFLFEKEIRVFGLKRSGNSAVVAFLWEHFEGGKSDIIHLNNTGLSLYSFHHNKKTAYDQFKRKFRRPLAVNGFGKCLLNTVEHMPILDASIYLKPLALYDRHRDCTAYRYGREKFSNEVYNIVLIRSFHNHLASIVRMGHRTDRWKARWKDESFRLFYGYEGYMEISRLWLQYAREVLNITNLIPDKLPVLYDKFVSSEDYRKELSSSLGLEYVDTGINYVSRVGSSFDGYKYRFEAQKMKVLDRWEYFLDENRHDILIPTQACVEKILHPEIVAYNSALFGIDLKELFNG